MNNCIECNHKFTFYDRFKSLSNLSGHLKCPDCSSVYKPKANIYRGIYTLLVLVVSNMVISNIAFKVYILNFILHMVIIVPILLLFDILPHRWHKYTKIK